jgi:hypothetical protein
MSTRYVYTNDPWHHKSAPFGWDRLAVEMTDCWGDSDPDSLKHLAAGSLALSAAGEPLPVFLKADLLDGLKILLDLGPLEALVRGLHAPAHFLKVALSVEHPLFHQVLDTAGRKGGGIPLVVSLLAQERHRPAEVMAREPFRPTDEIVSTPFVAEPVRTASHEPVERGEKHRPFHVKAEQTVCYQLLKNLPSAQFFPKALEEQCRTDLVGVSQ